MHTIKHEGIFVASFLGLEASTQPTHNIQAVYNYSVCRTSSLVRYKGCHSDLSIASSPSLCAFSPSCYCFVPELGQEEKGSNPDSPQSFTAE